LKITRREIAYTGKFIRVVNDYFQSDKGTGVWETVERLNVNNGAVTGECLFGPMSYNCLQG
jgi:hypothetical protein